MVRFEEGPNGLTSEADPVGNAQPALFLLSFRQRDELAAVVARGGWQVAAARRGEGIEHRFQASGAGLALIDARGAFEEGLTALRALRDAPDRPAATLTFVSKGDVGRLDEVYGAGSTHFLASPFGEKELLHAIRFAARLVAHRAGSGLSWEWTRAGEGVRLSPMLARLLKVEQVVSVRAALRALTGDARRALIASLRSMSGTTALVQTLAPLGRVALHLQHDAHADRLLGLVEPLVPPRDSGLFLHDAVPRLRDEGAMRRWIDETLGAGEMVHVAAIALGQLDMVNIAYGRETGDRLIEAVTRRIEETLTTIDPPCPLIARLGSADFALASAAPLDAACAAVGTALMRPFVVGGTLLPMSAQIRRVESRANDDAVSLMRRIVDAGAAPDAESATLDMLAVQVAEAIAGEQVEILWQPQVEIASKAIVGVEALARWRHPERGELGAEMLFGAAERAGLELALSAHIQAKALREAAGWPTILSHLRLSINVTAGDVARPDFTQMLLARIDDSGFPRGRLTVEITESGLMAELGEAAGLLADLRREGCRVAIDDFGTGYSSLAYLKALPLDYLKIDKALSQDIAGSPRDRIVVRGVIDMARSLGLAVVAEGVETETQLELLAKEGCQYFQGFLCAPPLGLGALEGMVRGD